MMPEDVVDLAAARSAAAEKRATRQAASKPASQPDLRESVEKLAGLTGELATAMGELQKTVASNTADIARLIEGFAALARLIPPPKGTDHVPD
jgi:hypothetical protein